MNPSQKVETKVESEDNMMSGSISFTHDFIAGVTQWYNIPNIKQVTSYIYNIDDIKLGRVWPYNDHNFLEAFLHRDGLPAIIDRRSYPSHKCWLFEGYYIDQQMSEKIYQRQLEYKRKLVNKYIDRWFEIFDPNTDRGKIYREKQWEKCKALK